MSVLRDFSADRLFRRARSTLVRASRAHPDFLRTRTELGDALESDWARS